VVQGEFFAGLLALEVTEQLEEIAETKPGGFVKVVFWILQVAQMPPDPRRSNSQQSLFPDDTAFT
jgi:hypothetical protein